MLGRDDARFIMFDGFVGFWAEENSHGFWNIHVEGEFKINNLILVMHLHEKIGRRREFLLFILHFFHHLLSKSNSIF